MMRYTESLLFSKVTKEEAEKMLQCSHAAEKWVESGEVIFGQNDKPLNIYLLLEGQVIITKYFPSGRRNILLTVQPGDVFGEIFFFSGEEYYWYDAVAVKKSKVLLLPYSFIYGFCSNACAHHKQIIRNLLDIQSKCSLQMMKKLHIVTGTTLKQRLGLWLLDRMDENGEIHMDMNREELADYLGAARPSLSRTLAHMQDEGIIELRKKTIRIVDEEKFDKMFEE